MKDMRPLECAGVICLEQGPLEGCCEQGDEQSGSIKGKEFFDRMSNCWILRLGCCMGVLSS